MQLQVETYRYRQAQLVSSLWFTIRFRDEIMPPSDYQDEYNLCYSH